MIGVERIHKIKNNVGEHFRSLLKDVSGLAKADNYSKWRQQESESLSILVQSRLEEIQNPPNWFIARQLVCKMEKVCMLTILFSLQEKTIRYIFEIKNYQCLYLNYRYLISSTE